MAVVASSPGMSVSAVLTYSAGVMVGKVVPMQPGLKSVCAAAESGALAALASRPRRLGVGP